MKYQIFKIVQKEVLIPSQDYYAGGDGSDEEGVLLLESYDNPFDKIEQAIISLNDLKKSINRDNIKYVKGDYTILPIYSI